MAQTLDNYLADKALGHQLYLQRFSAGEKKKVMAVLVDMRKELVAKLRAGDVTDFTRDRLKKLLSDCNAIIKQGYNDIQTKLDLDGLAEVEAEAAIRPLVAVGLEASLPTAAVMKSLVSNSLIEGAPSAGWWAKQSDDMAFKFSAQVRQGIAQGETMQQIVRRIAGSKKLGTPGLFEEARKNSFALVHTSVMQVAADARLATYKENSDIIKGVRQLSAMDGRTTPTCVAYSGAEWDLDGNPINGTTLPFNGGPPRHWNCLPGDTIISAAGISKHYKRWFDGEVIVLSIAGIDDVTITPNHPVLTDHGWIAAGLLKKGDNLVFCDDSKAVVALLNPSDHHVETRIKDVGDALLMSGGVLSNGVPSSPEDFHGDGSIDNEVSVILSDSFLRNNQKTGINEEGIKETLPPGHPMGFALNTGGLPTSFLEGTNTPPGSSMGCGGAGGSHLCPSLGGLNLVGLADGTDGKAEAEKSIPDNAIMPTSCSLGNVSGGFSGEVSGVERDNLIIGENLPCLDRQSETGEPAPDSIAAMADSLGDAFSSFSKHIGFVKIKDVAVRKYSSHVYNLQSDNGWYIVSITEPHGGSKGIIVHNCRSVLTPITKTFKEMGIKGLPELPDTGERASDLGPIDRKTTMDQFLKMHDTEWQDKMLGKGKAQLWRDGKITLSQLVSGSGSGRELTLEELKKL